MEMVAVGVLVFACIGFFTACYISGFYGLSFCSLLCVLAS